MLNSVTPFFIVDDLGATLAFYQSKLGFDIRYKGGGDGNTDDFWAILGRDRKHRSSAKNIGGIDFAQYYYYLTCSQRPMVEPPDV